MSEEGKNPRGHEIFTPPLPFLHCRTLAWKLAEVQGFCGRVW